MHPSDANSNSDAVLDDLLDQLIDAVQAGEPVDLEKLCRAHPHLQDRLRQLAPAVAALHELQDLQEVDEPSNGHQRNAGPEALGSGELGLTGLLGDFRILRKLGQGGMGVVYEAEQISLRRNVALKVLPFATILDSHQLQRFKLESVAAAQLDHPSIVSVYGVGCDRGVHYYAMRLVNGRSLAELLAPPAEPDSAAELERGGETIDSFTTVKELDPQAHFRRVAQMGIQIAEALQYAHERGVVHRDIKPSNLLMDVDGRVWVTDFGLAQLDVESNLTRTGALLGSPRYMSPEQAEGGRVLVDHRTDIYSLGVTLYELLTLSPARQGRDSAELFRQIRDEEPIAPRALDPRIPHELETVILKAIAREPEDRYASAAGLADDLRRYREHRPVMARRPTVREHVVKWCRRHVRLVTTVGILFVVAVFSGSIAVNLVLDHRRRADYERSRRQVQEAEARRSAEILRRHEYVNSINLAAQQITSLNPDAARTLLRRVIPEDGEDDHRGFAWYLLRQQCGNFPEPFARHEGDAYTAAFSPGGAVLATAGQDGIRLWDATTGAALRHLHAHAADVNWVSFSTDGDRFVSSGDDQTIRVWDTNTWQVERTIELPSPVSSVAFSPSGEWLAAAERTQSATPGSNPRNAVAVIEVKTWEPRRVLTPHTGWIQCVAFSADSRWLATTGDDGTVSVTDITTGDSVLSHKHAIRVIGAAFSPDLRWLFVTAGDGTVLVFDMRSNDQSPVAMLVGHDNAAETVFVFPGGNRILTSSRDGTARIWQSTPEPGIWSQVKVLRHRAPLWCAVPSPNGQSVVTTDVDGRVCRWNATKTEHTLPMRVKLPQAGGGREFEFVSDADHVLVAADSIESLVYADGLYRRRSAVPPGAFCCIDVSEDGRRYVAGSHVGEVQVRDAQTNSVIRAWSSDELFGERQVTIPAVACLPDPGAVLATAVQRPDVYLAPRRLNFATGEVQAQQYGGLDAIHDVLLSRDGEWFFLHDPRDKQLVLNTGGSERVAFANLSAWSFSADSTTFASAGYDRSIRICRTSDWTETMVFVTDSVTHHIALSQDGHELAVASGGTLQLWNTATGRLLTVLISDPHGVFHGLRFAPDDSALAGLLETPGEYELLIWRLRPE